MQQLRLTAAVVESTTGGALLTLEDLSNWLQAEERLRGSVTYERAAPATQEMGAMSEVLILAVGSGGAVTVLARSLSVWLAQQRSHVKLSIEREDGSKMTLDATNIQEPEKTIQSFVMRHRSTGETTDLG